ncbi:thermonuclease family protein [Pontibacter sp. E15-1]|uniref:thermonuclease family protein n=1 Tax=Pontibacter sp. E15-1 TaxID=2919918 RepID=UPI001F4F4D77|nr:thermonuclease family protein [Pontibacter sp. E15-1]MCJ8164533.1 thermonuclease family protein [Pontibacter sp. E15-1]
MSKYQYVLLLGLTLFGGTACKQSSREEAQQQFRQRQEAILERDAPRPAPAPTDTITTFPATADKPVTEPAASRTPAPAGDKVVGVKDGDTIVLLQNGEPVTVRLYGVDTPEKTQDYGQKAKQFTSDLVFGKQVRLIAHNTDRYGRTVGTIMLPDGRSLNEELVRNGYAWHYKAYSKDKNLANLEVDARRFKRGLWQDANPVAPWDYRKGKRDQTSASKSKTSAAPLPAGAAKRTVYLCNSSGSSVYHRSKSCHVLDRCKQEVLAVTEAEAIREYGRRADKVCTAP